MNDPMNPSMSSPNPPNRGSGMRIAIIVAVLLVACCCLVVVGGTVAYYCGDMFMGVANSCSF